MSDVGFRYSVLVEVPGGTERFVQIYSTTGRATWNAVIDGCVTPITGRVSKGVFVPKDQKWTRWLEENYITERLTYPKMVTDEDRMERVRMHRYNSKRVYA